MKTVFGWVEEHPFGGPFIVIIATALFVILLGPYSIFGIGTGYAFTRAYSNIYMVLAVGTFAVFIGALLGAIIAFFFGRYLCRKSVRRIS